MATVVDTRLAIDIGGTFTDVVLEGSFGRIVRKVLTTPSRPEDALIAGAEAVLHEAAMAFADVDIFVHGTTLATNAVLERRGARTALITTEGFRDVLEIGTEGRHDQYDLQLDKPVPLVPRDLRLCVSERMDARGQVRLPIDIGQALRLVPILRDREIESVAIAFLHAYANGDHERQMRDLLREHLPDLSITLASEVCPEIREYERVSTACANAYVKPLMDGYLARMSVALEARDFRGALYLMTSGGALTSVGTARRFPIRLVESGPAGGAMFAARRARQLGEDRVVAFDMGGTTAKVCLIRDGEPTRANMFEVDRTQRFLKGSGLPLRIPSVELVEIGAGGGSIVSCDLLGRVAVGPESAGSDPGPACYPDGGAHATVTDGNVALGLIDPANFAGGRVALSRDRAAAALDQAIGRELGLRTENAAYLVYEVVSENMASAVRIHAAERGEALSEFTMIAFGGGAPLHAVSVAEKVGIDRVIIPASAGVGSAVGFLEAPIAYEVVRSRYMALSAFDPHAAGDLLSDMSVEVRAVVTPGARGKPLVESRTAYMRYVGQGHELAVPLGLDVDDLAPASLRAAFEQLYAAQFTRFIPDARIEVLSWSVAISTPRPSDAKAQSIVSGGARPAPSHEHRSVFDGVEDRWVETPIYRRAALEPGMTFNGPAIILEAETSTFVTARFHGEVGGDRSLVLNRTHIQ